MDTATYSPEDNKLRLYPSARLDSETYQRVKGAGFAWAPKQRLFVAPAWTPAREDLLIELCGEVGDEDTSLVERAETRAERFEVYSDKRAGDAERAHAAVSSIADGIPLGQPILVGHHSERHARRDAEKIESGMRRAVKMWETSKYWEQRAAGALAHAKYKELPGVRVRRIKGLEAEVRKIERARARDAACLKLWEKCPDLATARLICARTEAGWLDCCKHPELDQYLRPSDVLPFEDRNDYAKAKYPTWTLEQVKERARVAYAVVPGGARDRWLTHYANRIAYERAMLAESGGIPADKFDFQPGGRVLRRGSWFPVVKVNRRGGVVQSVGVMGHFARTIPVEEVQDYKPPAEGDGERIKAATDKGPMCNYPGDGFRHMTEEEWRKRQFSDWPKSLIHKASDKHGKHRTRATKGERWATIGVYLTDKPRKDPPPPSGQTPEAPQVERTAPRFRPAPKAEATVFDSMRKTLDAGIQVVNAPQLFPTPTDVASRLVELAEIGPEHRVLEPSAGTGRLINTISGKGGQLVAVEINRDMADSLRRNWQGIDVRCADFLTCNGDLGTFDRIVMNPPFERGSDIEHIRHALGFLKPGGRLVAICANGPRQQAAFKDEATHWEDLPAGTFRGTGVHAAIVVIDR